MRRLKSPAPETSARRVSGTYGGEQYEISFFQPPATNRISRGERYCAGRGISVLIEVDDNFLGRQLQPFRSSGNYAFVRLVRDEKIDVRGLKPVFGEQFLANFLHFANGEFENLLALLLDIVQALSNRFGTGRE